MKESFLKEIENLVKSKKTSGASLGKKEINGKRTDEVSICFFVDKKKDISELPEDEIVPREIEIDGKIYTTDVKEVGETKFLACYSDFDFEIQRLRGRPNLITPLKGGQEILEFPTSWNSTPSPNVAGTLGFFAVDDIDNRVVGVTNTHVPVSKILMASDRNLTDVGEPYNTIEEIEWTFPSVGDIINGNSYFPSAVCNDSFDYSDFREVSYNIKRYIPFSLSGPNYVDAALLIMNPSFISSSESYQIHQPTTEPAYTAHLPFATTAEIDNLLSTDPTIYSTGRRTGPKGWGVSPSCQLTITDLAANINVSFSDGVVPFSDVIGFQFRDGSLYPINGGDSGSALIAVIGGVRKIIGICFAGNPFTGWACRIDRVADELKIREWDAGYVYDASLPTLSVVTIPKSDPRSNDTSLEDVEGDLVFQAGITQNTNFDEFN